MDHGHSQAQEHAHSPHEHPHGGHTHTHDGHTHSHEAADCADETLALLSYMYHHNVHHTEELMEAASQAEAAGRIKAAEAVREAAGFFRQGNQKLHDALHAYEEES